MTSFLERQLLKDTKNDTVLAALESILIKPKTLHSKGFQAFENTLSLKEVNEMEQNIADGCEQINKAN